MQVEAPKKVARAGRVQGEVKKSKGINSEGPGGKQRGENVPRNKSGDKGEKKTGPIHLNGTEAKKETKKKRQHEGGSSKG